MKKTHFKIDESEVIVMPVNIYQEDAQMIVDTVLSIHPKIDWKNPKAWIEKAADRLIKDAQRCEDHAKFFNIAQRFFKSISDAHTAIYKPDQLFREPPITLEEIEDQIVIDDYIKTHDILPKAIKNHMVLLEVDGINVEIAIKHIMDQEVYNVFEYGKMLAIRALLKTPQDQDSIALTLLNDQNQKEVITCPLFDQNHPKVSSWYAQKQRKQMLKAIEFDIFDDIKAGYLKYTQCKDRTIPSFVSEAKALGINEKDLPQIDEICDQLFLEMNQKGYHHLILDLRDNEGGDASLGYEIIKRITNQDILSYGSYYRASERLQSTIEKTIHLYQESHQKTLQEILDTKVGTIKESNHQLLKYPYRGNYPKHYQFNCQLTVLINHKVYSSGEWLAVELKDNHLATFIGTPTGGGGSVPGDTLTFRTPNTKILFDVSYRYFFRPDKHLENDRFVRPDHLVKQTLNDQKHNIDTVLTYAKNTIKSL